MWCVKSAHGATFGLAAVAGKGFLLKNTLTVHATHKQARVSSSELSHIGLVELFAEILLYAEVTSR